MNDTIHKLENGDFETESSRVYSNINIGNFVVIDAQNQSKFTTINKDMISLLRMGHFENSMNGDFLRFNLWLKPTEKKYEYENIPLYNLPLSIIEEYLEQTVKVVTQIIEYRKSNEINSK